MVDIVFLALETPRKTEGVSQDWEFKFIGKIPESKVVIAMVSRSYFESKPYARELIATIKFHKPILPVYLESVSLKGHFLGAEEEQIENANMIRLALAGNTIPPLDKGFFTGANAAEFNRNVDMVCANFKKKYGLGK